MADNSSTNINFSLNPDKTPVLYIDSYLISNNDDVIFFNFAQVLPAKNQHNIVARIALTKAQAKEFLKNLNDHMEKFEV